jgi:outer membrane protein insertion porin family
MRTLALRTLVLLTLIAPLPALAQYSIDKVVFTGGAPYSDADMLTVSGLATGQLMGQKSLVNAVQHLVDTGLFDDAQVSLSGTGKVRTVSFAMKPKPQSALLPVSIENLVWFTPEELAAGLRTRVPLYRGYASDAGTMPDLIQAALEQMSAAKGITATLTHMVAEPTSQHPVRVVDYKSERPAYRIASVSLAIAATSPEATAAAKITLPRNSLAYNEGLTGYTVEDFLLSASRNNGYITARLEDLQRELVDTANGKGVKVLAKVTPGDLYKVSTIVWTPTAVYSAADFARDAKLHDGEPAQFYKLRQTEDLIVTGYHAQGYLDAYLDPSPKLDTAAHTVAYSIHAVPGEQYHLKSVTTSGLSAAAQKEFDGAWSMKPGDAFNETYVQTFIAKSNGLPNLAKYAGGYQISADPTTHQVELTMSFAAGR